MIPKNGLFRNAPPIPDWLEPIYPFRRHIFTGSEFAIHFVDEGEGPPIMLLHGNPTWSFLWRKLIPILSDNGYRVIAPDLFGLGLSEKPNFFGAHSLAAHGKHIGALVRQLNLRDLTIVGQDWGGPILGLMAAENPERIHGAVFANTAIRAVRKAPKVTPFHRLSHVPMVSNLLFRGLNLPVRGMAFAQGKNSQLDALAKKAYLYPLRNYSERAAPLALARAVPTSLKHPSVETLDKVDQWANTFQGPVKLVWGTHDPVLGSSIHGMKKLFPHAPVIETEAGHFLQEQVPGILTQAIMDICPETSLVA